MSTSDLLVMLDRAKDAIQAFVDAQQQKERAAFLERLDQGAHVLIHPDTLAPLSLADADLHRRVQSLGGERVHHNALLPVGVLYAFDRAALDGWPLAGRAERHLSEWSDRWAWRTITRSTPGARTHD